MMICGHFFKTLFIAVKIFFFILNELFTHILTGGGWCQRQDLTYKASLFPGLVLLVGLADLTIILSAERSNRRLPYVGILF